MTDWDRISKIVSMLSSAADGEVVNAARLIAKQGVKFSELAERVRGGGGGFFSSPETLAQATACKDIRADFKRSREH